MWIDTLLLIIGKVFIWWHTITRWSWHFRCQWYNIKGLSGSWNLAERSSSMRNYNLQRFSFFIWMDHSWACSTSQKRVHSTFLLWFLSIKMKNSLCWWVVDIQFLCCLKIFNNKNNLIWRLKVIERNNQTEVFCFSSINMKNNWDMNARELKNWNKFTSEILKIDIKWREEGKKLNKYLTLLIFLF